MAEINYLIPKPSVENAVNTGYKGTLIYSETDYRRNYYVLQKDTENAWWAIGMVAKVGRYDHPIIVSDQKKNVHTICDGGGGQSTAEYEMTYDGVKYYVSGYTPYATDTVSGSRLKNNIIPYYSESTFSDTEAGYKLAGQKLLDLYKSAGGSFPGDDVKYPTAWIKKQIDGNYQKTFAFAHAKTVYTDYANKKTLADKLSEIDTSLDGKANSTHTHTKSQITDFPTLGTASAKDVASSGNASTTQVVMGNDTRLTDARKASDVSAWAKASVKPSYSKSEVGLGNVDNTSDTSKPVSIAQQTAIDDAYANANKYTDKKVANLIGSAPETMDTLEEVAAAIQENKDVETALNAAIGTKANQSELETHTGNSTIHITASERTKWNAAKTHADSTHARTDATKVEKSTTNGNIKINGTETTVYTHPGSGTNPHGTTKSDVGLGNVGNFKAVSTLASQGLTDTEKSNARANIGAGTSSFSGSYNDLSDKPTIPSVGNGTVTIKQAGTSKGTFTMNQTGNTTIELTDTDTTYTDSSGNTYLPGNLTINNGSSDMVEITKNSSTFNTPLLAESLSCRGNLTVGGSISGSLNGNASSATIVNGHTVNSDVPVNAKFTDTNTWRPLGTTADTACAGNDSRLSNARPANGGTANGLQDTHNGKNITASYAKSELAYSAYTWLAAWNGYELQTVRKDQFLASSGGTISGTLKVSSKLATPEIHGSSNQNAHVKITSYNNTQGEWYPSTTGVWSNGTSSNKWYAVWSLAFNGASDRKLKTDIKNIDVNFADSFIDGLKPSLYKFKNNSYGKTHTGFIAQDVEDLILSLGMQRTDFAGLVKVRKKTDEERANCGSFEEINYDPDNFEGDDANYDYSLRYDDFIAPLVAYCQNLKKKNTELEKKYNELTSTVNEILKKLN